MVQSNSDERFPLIGLNKANALMVTFDVLEAENDYFQYAIVHCDKKLEKIFLESNGFLEMGICSRKLVISSNPAIRMFNIRITLFLFQEPR